MSSRYPTGKPRKEWSRQGCPKAQFWAPCSGPTYDQVLRVHTLGGCSVLGYADDTVIIATASNVEQARVRANLQTALVVSRIKELSLKVVANKTKVILFHGPRRRPAEMPTIRIENIFVRALNRMKYLGIILDSRWLAI